MTLYDINKFLLKGTTVFKFMPVRQPKKIDPQVYEDQFITYDYDSPSSVYLGIASQVSSGLAAVESQAESYSSTSAVYQSKDELYDDFEGYDLISEWLVQKMTSYAAQLLEPIDHAELTTVILGILGAPDLASIDITTNKEKVWDTIIVNRVLNTKPELIEECQIILRLLNLIDKLAGSHSLIYSPEGLKKLYFATVVLTTPIFPLPKTDLEFLDNNDFDVVPPQEEVDYIAINSLLTAKQEIMSLVNYQVVESRKAVMSETQHRATFSDSSADIPRGGNHTYNRDDTTIQNDYIEKSAMYATEPQKILKMSGAAMSKISAETYDVLNSLGFDYNDAYVPDVLSAIDNQISSQTAGKKIKSGQIMTYQVGSALITMPDRRRESDEPYTDTIPMPLVKPLGIGDYHVVRQELLKYEATELAHIENILKGEKFERHHRNLSQVEEYSEFENEVTEQTETDVRTAERFELGNEIEKVVQNTSAFSAGIQVSGSYGVVSGSAYANYASTNSTAVATNENSNYAKDVVSQAVNKITKRSRQLRTFRTFNEEETTNIHIIDNITNGTDHNIGMYFWVDKVYDARLINLGRRLMYEFIIPEPAALHIYSKLYNPDDNSGIPMPINPASSYYEQPLLTFKDINDANYSVWASRYGVKNIAIPPVEFLNVGKSIDGGNNQSITTKSDSIPVPAGYQAIMGKVSVNVQGGNWAKFWLGEWWTSKEPSPADTTTEIWFGLNFRDSVPVSMCISGFYWANININCQRTPQAYEQWQMDTYNAIMDAYKKQLDEYNSSIENLKDTIAVFGNNPASNREIEREELKRSCIELFTAQRFENFNAMMDGDRHNLPKLKFIESIEQGKFIKFFEQAFEWNNMTYEFYSYFWGKRENWMKIRNYNDNDPLFQKFLQAGAARVIVPVNPEFMLSVLHYQESGQIWEGKDQPIIHNDEFISMLADVNEMQSYPEGLVLDRWEVKVPTNMVKLKTIDPENDPGLPDYSNPVLDPRG